MYRIGLGHDTHRLVEGNGFTLGGVFVPHHASLLGHSDADVLLHAITDSLLGAAGLDDIGDLFPDSDLANRGRDSAEMLQIAHELLRENNWEIVNIDCIIFAQQPKLGPVKEQIRERIAAILSIAPDSVGVKAKTGEHVGIIGREEAISAESVVLIQRMIR